MRRAALSAAIASPLLFLSVTALANGTLEVKQGEVVYLSGTVHFKSVVVRDGGTLRVRPLKDGEPGTGSLTIKAASVTVDMGGLIDATGAGYAGTNADGASCSPGSGGAVGPSTGGSAPGGGGANAGAGAAGCPNGGAASSPTTGSCQQGPGAAGGAAFVQNAPADAPNHGGSGGGVLSILASEVHIEGNILARGQNGFVYSAVGTGAGAGGYISIEAASIDGGGLVSVKGGAGGDGLSGHGGGGGGGTIKIIVAKDLPSDGMGGTHPTLDAGSGVSGTCSSAQVGLVDVQVNSANPCIDADEDGEPAEACGGKDCDDSDERIKGGSKPAIEICDGADNDCNSQVDDNLVEDACPENQACESGSCVDQGTGGAGGGSTSSTPPPDYLEYRGACDFGREAHRNGLAFYGAALIAFLAGLRAHRRRDRRK